MSKVGKKIIIVPESVKVAISDKIISVTGKSGTITVPVLKGISPKMEGNELTFVALNDERQTRANWGTIRALTQNAVTGVETDFTRDLTIQGVGYRAAVNGNTLTLTVGYSHPVNLEIPEGLKIAIDKNVVKVSGINKEQVGAFAAIIRAVRKPEPYKGSGIAYSDEVIRRKAGKKVAGK